MTASFKAQERLRLRPRHTAAPGAEIHLPRIEAKKHGKNDWPRGQLGSHQSQPGKVRTLLRLVKNVAAKNSPYDPCLVKLGDWSFKNILIQHDEVSQFAFLD